MTAVKRPYRSSVRQRRARATRTEILDAAHRLFLKRGYAATAISLIAAEADVAVATVYATFRDKPSILWALAERAAAGTEDTRLADSEAIRTLLAEPDPRRRLKLGVAWSVATHQRGIGDVERIVEQVALADRRHLGLMNKMRQIRHENSVQVVRAIIGKTALPPGSSIEDLADVAEAVDSVATFHQLTVVRGWTPERYETLIYRILAGVFFAGSVRPGGARRRRSTR